MAFVNVPMTRKQAADYISAHFFPVSAKTLATWATTGSGPAFVKVRNNRTLYDLETVEKWAIEQMSDAVTCTAQLKKK